MGIMLLLAIQAVAGPPVPLALRKPVARVPAPCPTRPEGGEIVVCGRTPESRRLGTLPEPPRGRSVQDPVTFRVPGGGSGTVHAIQTTLPGATGQGAAVTLRMPFGKGKRD